MAIAKSKYTDLLKEIRQLVELGIMWQKNIWNIILTDEHMPQKQKQCYYMKRIILT
jgi:hypothetical protein